MTNTLIRLRRTLYGLTSFFLRHLLFFVAAALVLVIIFAGFRVKNILREVGLGELNLFSFFRSPQSTLKSTNDRTNFLILGIRGEGEDSPDLTDTMLVLSYSYSKKAFSLISVPRDLWVSSLKTKINSVYHYGQFREASGGGIKLAQSAVLETLGLPIHYTAVIDFLVFQEAIDLVGGIDVDVQRSFTDARFPISGKENALPVSSRYETITFNAGLRHMDGSTALKFVRSRQAEGEEGTDIARDRRQQQVLSALKQKVGGNLVGLYRLLKENWQTNLDEKLYPSLARLAFDSFRRPLKQVVLSYEPDETGVAILETPPISPTYLNQWVLIARDNNWPALAQYLQNKLDAKR